MKRNTFALLGLTTTFALTLLAGTGFATIKVASPHRKVDSQGIGNCVFSTSELGFQKDGSYKLTTQFTAPQEVHSRCYFPKMTKEYESLGKVYNSLRDKREKYASFNVKGSHGLFQIDSMKFTYDDDNADWDQQRFDITGTADSDFMLYDRDATRFGGVVKNAASTAGGLSLDLGNYVKAMAESDGKYPYTAKFCMDVNISVADDTKTVEKWDSNHQNREWVKVPVYKTHALAQSCFDYTIKAASDVSWSAKDAEAASTNTPSGNTSQEQIDKAAKDLIKGLGF